MRYRKQNREPPTPAQIKAIADKAAKGPASARDMDPNEARRVADKAESTLGAKQADDTKRVKEAADAAQLKTLGRASDDERGPELFLNELKDRWARMGNQARVCWNGKWNLSDDEAVLEMEKYREKLAKTSEWIEKMIPDAKLFKRAAIEETCPFINKDEHYPFRLEKHSNIKGSVEARKEIAEFNEKRKKLLLGATQPE